MHGTKRARLFPERHRFTTELSDTIELTPLEPNYTVQSGAQSTGNEVRKVFVKRAAAHPAAELAGHARRRRIKIEPC